ncbi:MAG: TetR/AcrR family transcriptional regulator, mexCD-oprJ operon repressor [Actinomycetota bacterium]|jgi:AcrR family transcriptional regulator|nr:TetR/AcrR family transcriptional regulator, mexCD-oprJ operon repressor [Actinomycetota bacterium]
MDSGQDKLFRDVAQALVANPGASTSEIAETAGVSRATLHRAFGDREALVESVYGWLLDRCDQVFEQASIDEGPIGPAFDRLIDDCYPLAQSYWLLTATPSLEHTADLGDRLREQDQRLEEFFARGQAEGVFRPDLTPRWMSYSFSGQVMSAWYLVEDGYAGEMEVPRLIHEAVFGGLVAKGK